MELALQQCPRRGAFRRYRVARAKGFDVGTLFSALNIGRAGLFVAQVQLDTAGHNISNANKPGFSRQRVNLTTNRPDVRSFGSLGRGPAISGIVRLRDTFLDDVYRQQVQGLGRSEMRATYFTRMEDVFLEPSDQAFGTRLGRFFNAISDFGNNVEELPVRQALLSEGEAVASSLQDAFRRINTLRTNANEEIRSFVPQINDLTERIAKVNRAIVQAEGNGQPANDLRDDRDLLLDELAKTVNINYREREDGQMEVLLGNEVLVSGDRSRALEAEPDASIDPNRPDLLTVRFRDTGAAAQVSNGALFGAIQIRDQDLVSLQNRVDDMARAVIQAVNRVHSQGRGTELLSGQTRGTNGVSAPGAPLSANNLPFPIENGSFSLQSFGPGGNLLSTVTIPIVATGPGQTNLNNVVDAINATTGVSGLSAAVNLEGQLLIDAVPGNEYRFADDSSGVLTALGINGFFTGTGAADMAVSQRLRDNPALISSGFSSDPLETGDNSAALAMAALRTSNILAGGTQTLDQFYEGTIVKLGVDARANTDTLILEQNFSTDFERRRQEVSGVSIDEEVTFLLQYQRSFEGAARIITVADRMLETLLNIVQ